MECVICGSFQPSDWFTVTTITEKPDKYEQWLGLNEIKRQWLRCEECGHYQQSHNYDVVEFDRMYRDGYRDEDFRGKTINKAFADIMALPDDKSENRYRVRWLHRILGKKLEGKLLDIGSGIGVFPYEMKIYGMGVHCIESNKKDSLQFIINELSMRCDTEFDPFVHKNFDMVSMVHLLEHIQDPELFLNETKKALVPGGRLFIEVPDSVEFNYLEKTNDEFNSTHLHFFNTSNLCRLIDRCGFNITDIHRVKYPWRCLSRILLLATKL